MNASWIAILPPLIVIIIAGYTKRIIFALFMGIMAASYMVSKTGLIDAIVYASSRFWRTSQLGRLTCWDGFWSCSCLFILVFLLFLGIIIVMMRRTGAANALGSFAKNRIKTARGAESTALTMATLFSTIDDYFVSMALSSVMQPIADQFRIPRAKIAALVGIIAAPMSLLLPCPSWVAEFMGILRGAGASEGFAGVIIKADPLGLYFSSIPFMLYPILIVVVIWYMTTTRLSYGIIARQEIYAQKTGEQFGGKLAIAEQNPASKKIAVNQINNRFGDFLVPIITLYVSTISFFLWSGGWFLFGGTNSLVASVEQAQTFFAFAAGGFCTVIVSMAYYLKRKLLLPRELPRVIFDGLRLVSGAFFMLWFMWVFSCIIRDDLETATFLSSIMIKQFSISFLPVMFFIIATFISTVIGRAWGTIGILIPLALEILPSFQGLPLPVVVSQIPMINPIIGAIVSGAILGKHLSPVADSAIMTSTIVGCYHLDLIKSQIQLALPTFIASIIGFYAVGISIGSYGSGESAMIGLCLGLGINVVIVHILHWASRYKKYRFFSKR